MGEGQADEPYECKLCAKQVRGSAALIEHLRLGHSILELAVFCGWATLHEQRRDCYAKGLHRVAANHLDR